MRIVAHASALLVALTFPVSCTSDQPGDAIVDSEPAETPVPSTVAGMIVFSRAEGGQNVLMAMNPDASGMVSLRVRGIKPHVSPDGRKIVYGTPTHAIAVLDLATQTESLVASAFAASPKWSPDGKKILFWSDRGGSKELWTVNADGSGAVQLTDGSGGFHEADWSPDGTRIVARRVTGDGGDLWVLNADGSEPSLLYAGDRMDSDPRWSPDGQRIAFVRMVPKDEQDGVESEIFVIRADGSDAVRVSRPEGDDWSPTWSPDGAQVAFFGFDGNTNDPDLLLVRADGSDLRVLLGGPTYDHGPAFGPPR